MSVKIRLQRKGRKKMPYYYIVVADSRSPRDGKYIERIGSYNPNTNPATIELNNDKALEWMNNGAQPTDTCRAILSYKGILYRRHLDRGVKKGAFSAEEADKKFADWLESKAGKIEGKINRLKGEMDEAERTRLEREAQVSAKRAEELRAKRAAEEAPAAEAAAEEASEGEEAAAGEQPEESANE